MVSKTISTNNDGAFYVPLISDKSIEEIVRTIGPNDKNPIEIVRAFGLNPVDFFIHKDVRGENFDNCDLRGISFESANITGCSFKRARADLSTSFANAQLDGDELEGIIWENQMVSNTILEALYPDHYEFSEEILKGLDKARVFSFEETRNQISSDTRLTAFISNGFNWIRNWFSNSKASKNTGKDWHSINDIFSFAEPNFAPQLPRTASTIARAQAKISELSNILEQDFPPGLADAKLIIDVSYKEDSRVGVLKAKVTKWPESFNNTLKIEIRDADFNSITIKLDMATRDKAVNSPTINGLISEWSINLKFIE